MNEYKKREKVGILSFFNSIKTTFFFFTIHKTISTWAHIAGDNLPVLICMVSCVDDSQR